MAMWIWLSLAWNFLSGCALVRGEVISPHRQQTAAAGDVSGPVTLLRTPNGGIQPQTTMDAKGTLHLIYFKGGPQAGDIYYVRSTNVGRTFSAPLRVNSQPGSAIALGTIRGAQIAIGKDNCVHVAWNGSPTAQPNGPGSNPMLYARLKADGTAFEPQRNLITWAGGIDGGGAIAADPKGHVFVTWHAAPEGKDEAERVVYLARSTDNGRTFEREKRINPQPTGACGCCQMRAFVDSKGALYVIYRAAVGNYDRDMTLLVSRDAGTTFEGTTLHKWKVGVCPMSSESFSENGQGVFTGWETKDQVYYARVQPGSTQFSEPVAAPGSARRRKHPVVLANTKGEVLFAWTEGTNWNRGGSLAWQVYDEHGQRSGEQGRSDGVPVWGLLSAFVRPDGSFVLLY
jgi:hypothetical protein